MGGASEHYPLASVACGRFGLGAGLYKHLLVLQMLGVEVRIWELLGAGLFLIKDDSVSIPLLMDESHEVRAMAAWTLIQNGRERGVIDCGC